MSKDLENILVVSIEQAVAGGAGPRSTLATATEIADYSRLLWNKQCQTSWKSSFYNKRIFREIHEIKL